YPSRRPVRYRRKRKSKTGLWVGLGIGCGVVLLAVVGGCVGLVIWFKSPTKFPPQTEDYAQARETFQTRLLRQGPSPQRWQLARLVPGATEVEYRSGDLRLKAWVTSAPAGDAPKRPAVLFLHGGFGFDESDWEQAQPFRQAGFVVMTPWLRGENGLPGSYSMFY